MEKFYENTQYKGMVELVFKHLDIHLDLEDITINLYCHMGHDTLITLDINNLYLIFLDGDGGAYKIYGKVVLKSGEPFLSDAVGLGMITPSDYTDFTTFTEVFEPKLKEWFGIMRKHRIYTGKHL